MLDQPVNIRVLFLDIDGVLSPDRLRTAPTPSSFPVSLDGVQVWVVPELVEWLQGLVHNGVRVVWASTWVCYPDELETFVATSGLRNVSDRIVYDQYNADALTESGKRYGVQQWLRDRPAQTIVWVDDALGPDDCLWAQTHEVLAVRPDPHVGLLDPAVRDQINNHFGLPVQ